MRGSISGIVTQLSISVRKGQSSAMTTNRNSVESRSPRGDEGAVAVIGMACRLPMALGPADFWQMLRSGTDAITDAPPGRWNTAEPPAGSGVRRGGFIDGIADFDAGFFAVSPREAAAMDPQQRLVLELAWEALEDAGTLPARLRDSRTAVFVGTLRDDYTSLTGQYGEQAITQHSMTGLNRGVIANRVSYHLGLRGPSLTVDAAQSSSLVAVHLACESLRSGSPPPRSRPASTSTSSARAPSPRNGSAACHPTAPPTPSTPAPTDSSAARAAAPSSSSPWPAPRPTATASTASSAPAPSTTTAPRPD